MSALVPARPTDASLVRFVPYGSADEIKLSVTIVQEVIAVPTKSGKTCSRRDALKFIAMCQAKKLNPFEGDAFLIGYDTQNGPSFSLITAHQAFLKRAELHPEFDGMESGVVITEGEDGEPRDIAGDFHTEQQTVVGGWARVHYKTRKVPTYRRLRLARFNTGRAEWAKDPGGMICKCFDEETEILTTMGFEKFANAEGQILEVTEQGLEPTDSVPFFQPYSGQMVEWSSRNGNFRVTPNHDLPLAVNGEAETKIEARHLLDIRQRDKVLMPLTATFSKPDNRSIPDDIIRLAAAYIADGSDNSHSSGFCIAVSRPHKIEALREIGLYVSEREKRDKGGVAVTPGGRGIRTLYDKRAFYYSRCAEMDSLVTRGKNIQREGILSLSQRQAKLFLDTWLSMDGSRPDSCRVGRIYTSRIDHCRAIEVAACLAGYSISQRTIRQSDIGGSNWQMTLSDRRDINLNRQQIRNSKNDHGVWCVTVPSGKIIVRRHGFSCVSHNCAEADALRSSFPTMLGGLYMNDEVSIDVSPRKQVDDASQFIAQVVKEPAQPPSQAQSQQAEASDSAADEAAQAQAGLAPEQPKPPQPAKAVQDQLAEVVIGAGHSFEQWREWAAEQGHIKDRELPGFDLVPDAVAQRLIRARVGMLQQLKAKQS